MAQNSRTAANGVARRRTFKLVAVLATIIVVGTAVVWLRVVRAESQETARATFVAKRGPLTISVPETGTVQSREQVIIKNEVEGRTSIISLIPEGTRVKKGDLLVELDSSTLEDARINQEIAAQNADAAFVNARESLAVVKNQAQSDRELAELTLKFARQDLQNYVEGIYPNELTAAQNKVKEAEEVLARGEETLKWSQTLYDEKYISETELMADKLAMTRNQNSLTLAQNDLKLLEEFTYYRNIDQYNSDVNQAVMALERTLAKNSADIAQANADLRAKELEYNRQQDKMAKLTDQLDKTVIKAPAEGMVIYATTARSRGFRDNREPLDEGVEVFERQDLIYLPTTASAMVEVDIHEASLDKVRLGLPAVITVDALPGKQFIGTVGKIAPLPDPQSMWMNPDLKVYESEVYLEGEEPDLRTGMSCNVEIIVAQYEDAVYIPVHAVIRVGGQPTVYVVKDDVVEERAVEIGLDNNRMIKITDGLQEGEVVLLTPPLKAAAIEEAGVAMDTGLGPAKGSDAIKQRVSEKLEAANGQAAGAGPGEPAGGPAGPSQEDAPAPSMPSPQQMEQMRRRIENMSPEERQKAMEEMRKRFENMTPEERERMRQRFQGGGRRPGGGSGPGGGPGRGGGPRPDGGPRQGPTRQGGGPGPGGGRRPQGAGGNP